MKRLLLVTMVVVGAVVGGAQISASASSTAPVKPFLPVTIPTGPELPLKQVEEIALTNAKQAGDAEPSMALVKGTLEDAILSMSPTGILDGLVLLIGGPAKVHGPRSALRYTVLIKQGSRVVAKAITSTHGFRVRLRQGRYVVNGEQGVCKAQSVVVRSGKRTNTTLICSIR